MKKLLPLLLFLIGSGAGVGAGIFMKPDDPPAAEETAPDEAGEATAEPAAAPKPDRPEGYEYVKLSNQFVVPIVRDERIASMVVASLSIEIATGYAQEVLEKEPKLRDAFLRVMFDHANMGGFDGAFTELRNLDVLQAALLEVAQKTLGADLVSDVLIFEIARQDY